MARHMHGQRALLGSSRWTRTNAWTERESVKKNDLLNILMYIFCKFYGKYLSDTVEEDCKCGRVRSVLGGHGVTERTPVREENVYCARKKDLSIGGRQPCWGLQPPPPLKPSEGPPHPSPLHRHTHTRKSFGALFAISILKSDFFRAFGALYIPVY